MDSLHSCITNVAFHSIQYKWTHCNTQLDRQARPYTWFCFLCSIYCTTALQNEIMICSSIYFSQEKNTITIENTNSSLPFAQSSCFRGGFKACHKTSCIVNSAASMADWWAICLVDCLAPGPWSYVYVWALLFHMYRPRIIFYFLPPHFRPCRTDDIHIETQAHIKTHCGKCAQKHTHTHTCVRTDT